VFCLSIICVHIYTCIYRYMYTYIYIYLYICMCTIFYVYTLTYICIYTHTHINHINHINTSSKYLFHFIHCFLTNRTFLPPTQEGQSVGFDDDDDVYFKLQQRKGFHNLVYMSYVKHINPASTA
jgi:hypothetical protein